MNPEKKIKSENPENCLFDLDELIKFRRNMHMYPEIGFQEFKTQQSIKEYLLKLNVKEEQITVCAKTGYYVDLFGKAKESGSRKLIALRADIDALSMTEGNENLEYRSKTKACHGCGHDGHTTTMLGFVSLFQSNLEKIPKDRGVRILFQPSEEGPESGAIQMIKEGCLETVDECYGYHNYPNQKVGTLMTTPGPMMASISRIEITFYGKGGHGSAPQSAIDPVQMSVSFYRKFNKINNEIFKGKNFICTIPCLKGGERYNVIANSAYMEGSLRSLENGLPTLFEQELQKALKEVDQEFPGGSHKLNFVKEMYAQVNNTEKEAENVIKLGKEFFGEEQAGTLGEVPIFGSEDFSFFIQKVPGCFYFLGSGKIVKDTMLHHRDFNFNDDLIKPGAEFFWKLIQNRLEL